MFRTVGEEVWAFDAEWVPDQLAGRLLYDLPETLTESAIMEEMWKRNGATEEDPTPYLKTVLCRLVSIAMVVRKVKKEGVLLSLYSLPKDLSDEEGSSEKTILSLFLEALGKIRPQLVGFNSINSDLRILIQRGVVHGLHAKGFATRPNKPWEGYDYFSSASEGHVDLREIIAGWGKSSVSLNDVAVLSRIPGKMDVDGEQVSKLWLEKKWQQIIDYNECDAFTTYLVWLRLAHFAGHFSPREYETEQDRVKVLLAELGREPRYQHLRKFLTEWERLREIK